MIIRLPQIGQIDTENLPDNFDEVIERSFQRYTAGTRKEYRYQDKLEYIDAMRKQFWHARDTRQQFSAGFLPFHGRYTGGWHEDGRAAKVLLRIIRVVDGYEM